MNPSQPITFFLDRCLGNKEVPQALRKAGLSVEIHADHFRHNAPDVDWLPEVGSRQWVVLTKDEQISKRSLERIAVASANVQMFILTSQNLSGMEMAEIFVRAAVTMQEFARNHPVPFIAKIYKSGDVKLWRDRETLLRELEQWR